MQATLKKRFCCSLVTLLLYTSSNWLQADTRVPTSVTRETTPITKIFGGVERLGLPAAGLVMDARIDTGAEFSSLDARNIREFTREQQRWISFEVVDRDNGSRRQLCAPLNRYIRIKRHGTVSQCRPVVCLAITIGQQRLNTAFSLTDRSQFQHPVLIGRNYLLGQALVDVSREHLAGFPTL